MGLREDLEEASEDAANETNENIPMDGHQDKYRVDCCSPDCPWTGYSTDCLRFKHDTGQLSCPECHEVVEPVED